MAGSPIPLGLLVLCGAALAGSKDMGKLTQTDVFVSGREGYHTFRIPALVVSGKGTLLAFCEGRKASRSDHGDIDLVLKRSTDNGRSWSQLQIVHDEGGDAKVTIGNPCPVVDRATGTIWLPFTRTNDRVFVTHSADDGVTWATPREITQDVKLKHWTWYATGPGHGIQLTSGRLLIPCDHRDPTLPPPKGRKDTTRSHMIFSDDGGATWKLGGALTRKTNECEAVQTIDGSLYLNMRNNFGKARRAVAWSRDGGQTWSEAAFDDTLVSPTCQASAVRYTDARRQDRNRVVFANPASKSRSRMTVRLSTDECRTWSAGKVLHAGPAAYSDLAVAPDLDACCLYERGDKHAYERIAFAKFDLAWLTDGADRLAAKHLLLDSRIIERTENARLALGKVEKDKRNPLFKEDKPWEPRFDNLYANVLLDDGLYKCWYSPFIIDRPSAETSPEDKQRLSYSQVGQKLRREKGKGPWREMGICYATSKDGIAWDKPHLGLVDFKGSKANNLVVRGPHGTGIFKDLRETDPQRRYKMLFKAGRMTVAFSPDGLRWSKPVPCPAMAARGDTHNNAFWAPDLGRYVAITRLYDGQRTVGRAESPDFVHWTQAVEVLRGDKANQTYAMPVFRYANAYLGLVMILRRPEDRVHCELAWSPDTVHWHRVCPGTPFIPNSSRKGDYDWGCVYAAACPVVLDNEIRLYYGGNNGQHTNWRDGFFCLAHLRPDGFACMEPAGPEAVATIITKPVLCVGKRLTVSADAAGGSLRVAVEGADGFTLDACTPIGQDVTDGSVQWEAGRDLAAFVGKPVRLRFELSAARLYAFGFRND